MGEFAGASVEQVAEWLRQATRAVAFTGAGISTESGIPDFRSPGGIWSQSQPVYFDDFLRSPEARHEYWRQKVIAFREFSTAQPNVGHQILAKWEAAGRLRGVITQNIDELHQLAGSHNVLELHGTARKVSCLACGALFPVEPMHEAFERLGRPPECPECGGMTKHATVSFGQALPQDVVEEATRWASSADLFFAIGSSLVVYPAAGLPELAARSGAKLVIINRDSTPLDSLASACWRVSIGEALQQLDHAL